MELNYKQILLNEIKERGREYRSAPLNAFLMGFPEGFCDTEFVNACDNFEKILNHQLRINFNRRIITTYQDTLIAEYDFNIGHKTQIQVTIQKTNVILYNGSESLDNLMKKIIKIAANEYLNSAFSVVSQHLEFANFPKNEFEKVAIEATKETMKF
jgi:hypothetical protein